MAAVGKAALRKTEGLRKSPNPPVNARYGWGVTVTLEEVYPTTDEDEGDEAS